MLTLVYRIWTLKTELVTTIIIVYVPICYLMTFCYYVGVAQNEPKFYNEISPSAIVTMFVVVTDCGRHRKQVGMELISELSQAQLF